MLARAHLTYFIIDPFFFFASCDRGGLALEAPLYNFKTSRDIVSFAAVIRAVTQRSSPLVGRSVA